ncbi:hypothetical protein KIL84_002475 [Mauremys mutica]|uniref:Uncharacterized protein n=1 Tax=Mauremys mutica TaxID=74926 RepID=A0A9D4AZA5_9SAUR|nr:hypothetical protein KIL84_002475 [Mauremys mutica]
MQVCLVPCHDALAESLNSCYTSSHTALCRGPVCRALVLSESSGYVPGSPDLPQSTYPGAPEGPALHHLPPSAAAPFPLLSGCARPRWRGGEGRSHGLSLHQWKLLPLASVRASSSETAPAQRVRNLEPASSPIGTH